ncbi:hypothetical protein HanRHA438_Chr08g0369671 [Helianthus annuus]|nr:hypothetical protein HanHA300_Chr08g0295261 [Helianthus annuus]KAJ0554922.1 hypothetical protein HanHA89_Chr08g0313771 [Helianthus annuus]KAJ0720489.1 hypothetical protein HanLR1_Chr08g0294121 [Helianthus annuus]KAJ0899535.1 hypothetical protein HanRHA438_Chr08g0369671 [Helianthus annuus]
MICVKQLLHMEYLILFVRTYMMNLFVRTYMVNLFVRTYMVNVTCAGLFLEGTTLRIKSVMLPFLICNFIDVLLICYSER